MYSIGGQTGLQRYCDTSYSWRGVNQMTILEDSKDLLEYVQFRPLHFYNSIETFDFSTLYPTIPHSKLKDRFGPTVFHKKKNGQRRYIYLVLGKDRSNFVNKIKKNI
jgi:hypothetical protein